MGITSTRFLKSIKQLVKGKSLTDSRATNALSRWLYQGHGEKYLSLPVCEDGIGRPPDSNPRRFLCPDTAQKYARWLPFRNHITGDQKGIVADAETKLVPFITVDIDRHDASVSSWRHQEIAILIGRHLCKIAHIKWIVEVNPKNGSAKFFGFRRAGDHFLSKDAQSLASNIRHELIELNLCHDRNIEVFPDNCKAVFLPLRRDKITISDHGMLPRVNRKIKDVRFYGQTAWEYLRCYSAMYFVNWIYQGDNFDEDTLVSALRYSCIGLSDEVALECEYSEVSNEILKACSPQGSKPANKAPGKLVCGDVKYDFNDPCALKRNWSALLPFARQYYLANKRLPSVEEALEYLKQNGLYSGDWAINEGHRHQRVANILGKIKETFDPSLLQNNISVIIDPEIRCWCRQQFPNGLVGYHRRINEFDMSIHVQSIQVPARFVEKCVGVISFCLNDHLENQALPVNRIKAIWNLIEDTTSWNQTYFQIVRNHLERLKVINIFDKNHQPGKAWKWKKGENFPTKMWKKNSEKRVRRAGTSSSGRPSTAGAREWAGKGIRKERIHNSLYQTLRPNSGIVMQNSLHRGPPETISIKRQLFHIDRIK
tara:strand:- start:1837 stop:3630 length:1794 start_codon:yes stop_codon:yes gene_type:complete